jgi:Calcineurin-like phosphoesterase
MRKIIVLNVLSCVVLSFSLVCAGQSIKATPSSAAKIPLSQQGPTFKVDDKDLRKQGSVIAYGDMRFTDPTNVTATNPAARRALVARVSEEHPDAILLNGDIPWHGGDKNDYLVYHTETASWREGKLRVYPALGNHEFGNCKPEQCLENWWGAFPELKDRRWYSVQLGRKLYLIALDSDDSLLPESEQHRWLQGQIKSLPASVQFVMITMHHPPVADIQTKFKVNHNPRPNEIALAELLKNAAVNSAARFVVVAGHIHNYERFLQGDVVYLVSGGGGAEPYPVERMPTDLYQDTSFPNYHYVKFVLENDKLVGMMYRLADPEAEIPKWEAKDSFEISAKTSKTQAAH